MPRRLLLVLAAATLALSTSASAQLCAGFASFSQTPFQVSITPGFGENSKSFAGGFAFGSPGPFAGASVGMTVFDTYDKYAFLLGGGAGYQAALGQKGLVHLCPIVAFGYASGPNNVDVNGDGSLIVDLKETSFSAGMTLGVVASQSPKSRIIPNVSLAFVSATLKEKDDATGASASRTETFGSLGLGLGFVFNQVLALRPGVAIPLGLDGASTSWGVALGVNFGRRTP